MTELEVFQPRQQAVEIAERPMRLVEWAEEARAANLLAQSLCQTPFAGQYQNNPLAATAAILKGAEVGLTPVTALGAFDLIQGTPAPKAITLRALVQSHGHSVWIEESSDARCVAKARRAGESVTHESVWTIGRATKLGLTNKQNWKNQPAAMLIARATSEVCRMVAADVILGIGYSSEEVTDDQVSEPTTTVRRAPTKAQRRTVAPEPDLEPVPVPAEAIAEEREDTRPEPVGITEAQMKMLHASFNEVGISDRDQRLAYCANLLGREVTSSKELSKDEASRVIDALVQDAGDEGEQA